MPRGAAAMGATGPSQPANQEIQKMVDMVKDCAMERTNMNVNTFTAHSYASQIVAGVNHFIKVDIGGGKFVHLRVHEPLPPNHQNFQLQGVRAGMSEQDPIVCFDEEVVEVVDR